jgi:hypothetical protein
VEIGEEENQEDVVEIEAEQTSCQIPLSLNVGYEL